LEDQGIEMVAENIKGNIIRNISPQTEVHKPIILWNSGVESSGVGYLSVTG
jgi:hypothetical protein